MLKSILVLASLLLVTQNAVAADSDEDNAPPPQSNSSKVVCLPRENLINQIKTSSHAVPVFVGLVPREGIAVEVWKSTVNELWIEFVTRPDNISCVVFEGNVMGFADPETPKNTSPEPEKRNS